MSKQLEWAKAYKEKFYNFYIANQRPAPGIESILYDLAQAIIADYTPPNNQSNTKSTKESK